SPQALSTTASSTGSVACASTSNRRNTRIPADRPLRKVLSPRLPPLSAPGGSPRKIENPATAPRATVCHVLIPCPPSFAARIRPSRWGTLGLDASKRQGTSPRTTARLRFAHGSPGRARTQALRPAGARGPLGDGQALRRDDLLHPAGGGTGPTGAPRRVAGGERAHGHGDAATPGPRRLRRDRGRPQRHPHADRRGPGRQDRPRAPAPRTEAERALGR